jgi:predicted Zn-dependent peptidase
VSTLRTAQRERFVSFYEQYYRPENATFIERG